MGNSANEGGWIKLHRKITKNWIWEDPEKLKAWIDILLMVNHEDKQIPFNGHIIVIKKGQKLTSLSKLAVRWGWTRNRVDRFLRLLNEAEMVTAVRTPNGTVLTVENYGFYQGQRDSNEATNEATHEATVEATHEAQTRIYKNDKEGKEYMAPATHTPPTLDEVRAYCAERGNNVDPEKFVAYYELNGWVLSRGQPMRDWKAAVRYWETREKKEARAKPTKFSNYQERSGTDWDALELAAIKKSMEEPVTELI